MSARLPLRRSGDVDNLYLRDPRRVRREEHVHRLLAVGQRGRDRDMPYLALARADQALFMPGIRLSQDVLK